MSLPPIRMRIIPQSRKHIRALSNDNLRLILRDSFKSSWNCAKRHLTTSKKARDKQLMRRLIKLREFDCNAFLNQTQIIVNRHHGPKGLTGWSHSGSTKLTSDLDINLKGSHTEYAVTIFNRLFRAEWQRESGTVYDINVYALDFLHGCKRSPSHTIIARQEFDTQAAHLKRRDSDMQLEWAMMKLKLHMTPKEWRRFRSSYDPKSNLPMLWENVNYKHRKHLRELDVELRETENLKRHRRRRHANRDKHLAASNRIYERKLQDISELRQSTRELSKQLVTTAPHKRQHIQEFIDHSNTALRELLSEAVTFAHEAYLTAAAVQHTVLGLQRGNAIQQTRDECFGAIIENYADIHKVASQKGITLGKAVHNSLKYIRRMTDAIIKLKREDNPEILQLIIMTTQCQFTFKTYTILSLDDQYLFAALSARSFLDKQMLTVYDFKHYLHIKVRNILCHSSPSTSAWHTRSSKYGFTI